jgi:hypothetical protein
MVNLDTPIPDNVPNPPPWQIHYISEGQREEDNFIPVAKTQGLKKFNVPELQIRYAPPNLAASLLDRLAIWLIYENNPRSEEAYSFAGIIFAIIPVEGLWRIMWEREKNGSK